MSLDAKTLVPICFLIISTGPALAQSSDSEMPPINAADRTLLGFTADATRKQLELEARFDDHLDADNLRNWMQYFTSKPIYVGSPHNKETAEWMVERFRSWGFDAELAVYRVLFPTPKVRQLELIAPTRYTARLREPELPEDGTSGIQQDRLPPYNAYSADGDVTEDVRPRVGFDWEQDRDIHATSFASVKVRFSSAATSFGIAR